MATVWDLMDEFHDASDETQRNAVRHRIRLLGYNGVADTILTVSEGGIDRRVKYAQEVAEINRRAGED